MGSATKFNRRFKKIKKTKISWNTIYPYVAREKDLSHWIGYKNNKRIKDLYISPYSPYSPNSPFKKKNKKFPEMI